MLQRSASRLSRFLLMSCLASGAWSVAAQGQVNGSPAATSSAAGNGSTKSALPEVLRDMPLAGQMCKNERSDNSTGGGARSDSPADMGCALPVSGVAAFLQKPGAVVVDTRQESPFAQFHLASAMRMDAASLRLKSYLKDKPVLLVGDGKGERELYAACGALKTQGFRTVQVLHGGMPAYLARELPVVGSSLPATVDLVRLDAAEVWAESQFVQNLVLTAGSSKTAELLKGFATPVGDGPQALATAVERRRRDAKTPPASVVLVVDATLTEASFREYARAVAPLPLLLYGQGAEPLAKFLKSQEAVWAAHTRGPKQPRCG